MKKSKVLSLLLVCIMMTSVVLVGCGGSSTGTNNKVERLSIATGGTSGVYYPLGGAFANILNDKVSGVTATAESTGASLENVNLLNNGDVDFALIQNDISHYAFNGIEMFSDKDAMKNIRAVASLYPETIQIVANTSANIKTVEDLKGKKVAVGAPGSGVEVNARQILAAHGLSYDDLQPDFLSFGEAADGIKDGRIDAAFLTAGTPTAAVTDLSTTHSINLVPITTEKAQGLINQFPFYFETVIPAGTYRNQDEEISTLAVMAMLTVNANLSDDLVYNATKAFFENLDTLAAAHKRGEDISLEGAKYGISLEIHPGAQRYYDEVKQ